MPRGPSGRIVVEVEQELKGRLHATLALDGLTMKDWFVERATDYVETRGVLASRRRGTRNGGR
jgi:hypothetical protein